MFKTIKFVIPSYNRVNSIKEKSLNTLEKLNIPKKQIYIFVVDTEYEDYKTKLPEYNNIIIGVLGLCNQRNFITNYFRDKTKLINLDDDIEQLFYLDDNNVKQDMTPDKFKKFMITGFTECIENDTRLFGISPTDNYTRFVINSITYNLNFCIGHFWGCINDKSIQITIDIKEDYERTILYWMTYKCIIRLNFIWCKTRILTNPGGLQITYPDRTESSKNNSDLLVNKYPLLIAYKTSNSSMIQLRFKRNISIKNYYTQLPKLDESIFTDLIKAIEDANLPINKKRENTGEGITHSFGLIRKRQHKGLHPSKRNIKYPDLYKALEEYGQLHVLPYVKYTGIQVNKNFLCKAHHDTQNIGQSYIVGFGDYTGGELKINSYNHNIHNNPVLFNGCKYLHETQQYVGNRYSLVYFTQRNSLF